MGNESKTRPLHENLDTTFVNLWSLLRSLTQKGFVGRVHVVLRDYSADIFLNDSSTPMVREVDHLTGEETFEEAALHRLVLRARETPGTITVFEGNEEAAFRKPSSNGEFVATPRPPAPRPSPVGRSQPEMNDDELTVVAARPRSLPNAPAANPNEAVYATGSYQDWPAILATTGELIAAIEHAVNAIGDNFEAIFTQVRVELGDDYNFLDPTIPDFQYGGGRASLQTKPPVPVFVAGLSEALRRVIDRVASGERARRVRERVALEMFGVARKQTDVLERSGFLYQLDRIAGTRVM